MRAAWLKKDEAVSFETHVIETDDDDKSTESWAKLKAVLSSILSFLTEKIKVKICVQTACTGHDRCLVANAHCNNLATISLVC